MKTRTGGYQYQINLDHHLIKKLFEIYPNASRSLEALFHLIESRLPLNSLYLDLVQDEKITNNDEQPQEEILTQIKGLLSLQSNYDAKHTALKLLLENPPFSQYKDVIIKNIKGIIEDA